MRFLPDHPPHVLRYAALLTGGAMLLVLGAFGLSGNFSELAKVSNLATVTCSSPSQCEEQVGAGGYIRAAAGQVVTGNSTTITWNAPTSASDCWGNGTSCGSAIQTLPASNSYEAGIYGGNYLVTSNRSAGAYMYRWMSSGAGCPTGGGWGDGSSCGSILQTIGGSGNTSLGVDFYSSYLILTNSSSQSRMYQWTSSGSGCPSGGGFGNGSSCTSEYQGINPGQGDDQSESGEVFSVGGGQYFIMASNAGPAGRMFRWMSSGTNCPASGGWGNGTKCGDTYQSLGDSSWDSTDWKVFGSYALVAASNNPSRMYVWTSSGSGCPANGGWGNGSACGGGNSIQTLPSTVGKLSSVSGGSGTHYVFPDPSPSGYSWFYQLSGSSLNLVQAISHPGGMRSFGSGYTNGTYYLFGAGNSSSGVYEWMSGSSCWGDGTSCGNPTQTIGVSSGRYWITYTQGSNTYALLTTSGSANYVYRYMPACTVTRTNSGGTTQLSTASSGSLSTGALTQDTTYTMTCSTAGGGSLTASIVVDVVPKPTVSVAVSQHASEPSSPGYFTISALAPVPANLTVNYNTSGISATPGTDYSVSPSNSVTIPQGQQSALVVVTPVSDSLNESTETMRLTISSNSAYTIGSPTNATMNITNTPTDLCPSLAGTQSYYPSNSSPPSSCTGPAGSSYDSGTNTFDYCPSLSGIQTSYPSNSSPSNSCTGPAGWTYNSGTGLFEAPPIPTLTLAATASAAEGGSNGNFRVTANQTSASNITVSYTVTGGSATQGTDYSSLSGSVTLLANQLTANIPVTAINDSVYEGTETIALTLSSSASYNRGSPFSATTNLIDNETVSTLPSLSTCSGGSVPPSCTFAALFGSVPVNWIQAGQSVVVSWNVTGLVTGENGNPGNTCTISAIPASALTSISWPGTGSSWVGARNSNPINQTTIFTLTCTAPNGTQTTSAWTVRVVPRFFEV